MTDFNHFQGAATRRDEGDIAAAALLIGCNIAALHAVLTVETGNRSGFDDHGRPKMLFEPHIFFRELRAGDPRLFNQAVAQKLAYPTWGMLPYPADSYPRLEAAIALNETAALHAASWGLGQVMGFNYAAAGCATVQEMVLAAMDSEAAQLGHVVGYILTNGLSQYLIDQDWPAFAAAYNGRGQIQVYAGRLATAYGSAMA